MHQRQEKIRMGTFYKLRKNDRRNDRKWSEFSKERGSSKSKGFKVIESLDS